LSADSWSLERHGRRWRSHSPRVLTDSVGSVTTGEEPARIARSWLRYQNDRGPDDLWSLDAVSRSVHGNFSEAWAIVVELCSIAESDEALCSIGSGPIEDLVRAQPEQTVAALEALVDSDPRLAAVAACIWAWDSPYRSRIDRLLEKHEQRRL
jgi:hypothetical protein